MIKINILWVFFAPLVIVFMINKLGITSKLIFASKDILFYLFFLFYTFTFQKKFYFQIAIFGTLFWYILLLLIFNGNYTDFYIANIRQMITPLIILILFKSIELNDLSKLEIIQFIYKVTVSIVLLGFIFLLIDVWNYISLHGFFQLKGIPTNEKGLSYMFYEPIIGYAQRMVSTILDPISLGHMLASVAIAMYYKIGIDGKKRIIFLSIVLLGLLFTFSKGAMLQFFIAVVIFDKNIHLLLKVFALYILFIAIYFLPNKAGLLIHLHGTINAFDSISMIGYGIGSVGNYAKMFSSDLTMYELLKISDTFLGSLLGQVGIIGVLIWLYIYLYGIKSISNPGAIIIISQLLIGILSENTMNFSSFFISGLLGGLIINMNLFNYKYSNTIDSALLKGSS